VSLGSALPHSHQEVQLLFTVHIDFVTYLQTMKTGMEHDERHCMEGIV